MSIVSYSPSGLSPRVRGNLGEVRHQDVPVWSIPACAGEPRTRPLLPPTIAVYPRVCGGTAVIGVGAVVVLGLSPRVRGNPPAAALAGLGVGSIPACAGEPPAAATPRRRTTVYPRVCGGTRRTSRRIQRGGGLSPRVRGNLAQGPILDPFCGSIPACAGEPARVGCSMTTRTVYPRVCGGTDPGPGVLRRADGLSPRVRGNLPPLDRYGHTQRSIPACAGEPAQTCKYAVT